MKVRGEDIQPGDIVTGEYTGASLIISYDGFPFHTDYFGFKMVVNVVRMPTGAIVPDYYMMRTGELFQAAKRRSKAWMINAGMDYEVIRNGEE